MNKTKNSGITLVALVITVIILLILAGITISQLTGSGLFENAKLSKEKNAKEQMAESLTLALQELQLEKRGKATISDITQEWIDSKLKEYKNTIIENTENNSKTITIEKDGIKINYIMDTNLQISESQNVEEPNTEESEKYVSYKFANNRNINARKYTELIDNTQNGNNATLYNISTTNENDGIVFNGKSSYAQLNMQNTLTFPLTIETTLKCPNSTTYAIMYFDSKSKTALGIWEKHFVVSITTKSKEIPLPENFFDGNLKHIVVVYNSLTDFKVYVNGTELAQSTETDYWGNVSGENTYIGQKGDAGYFKGTIYNLRIYEKALTENEVISSYNSDKNYIENNQNQQNRSDLILEYTIKNNGNNVYHMIPNIIKDISGNNNNATCNEVTYNSTNNGITFNGTSSYLQFNMQDDVVFPLTIETVFQSVKTSTNTMMYFDPKSKTALGIWEKHFVVSISTKTKEIPLPTDFFDGNLKHIVVVYNSLTDFKVYVNGTELAQSSDTDAWGAISGENTYIGQKGNSTCFLNGTLYEFSLYKKLLNEQEILNKYNRLKY